MAQDGAIRNGNCRGIKLSQFSRCMPLCARPVTGTEVVCTRASISYCEDSVAPNHVGDLSAYTRWQTQIVYPSVPSAEQDVRIHKQC